MRNMDVSVNWEAIYVHLPTHFFEGDFAEFDINFVPVVKGVT
jgi:hypothetical protein